MDREVHPVHGIDMLTVLWQRQIWRNRGTQKPVYREVLQPHLLLCQRDRTEHGKWKADWGKSRAAKSRERRQTHWKTWHTQADGVQPVPGRWVSKMFAVLPVNTARRVLGLRMEERPPSCRVTANILNKQSRTADKGWSSSLGVGRGADNLP